MTEADARTIEERVTDGLDPVEYPPPFVPELGGQPGSRAQRCRCSVVPVD